MHPCSEHESRSIAPSRARFGQDARARLISDPLGRDHMTYTAPEFRKAAFNCPHCGAYAHQTWSQAAKQDGDGGTHFRPATGHFFFSCCAHCANDSVWHYPQQRPLPRFVTERNPKLKAAIEESNSARLVYPSKATGSLPSADLPPDIRTDFLEARTIAAESPRGAAALLRLCIQKLCLHLGENGTDLNSAIGKLVARGLPSKIQMALDTVRVIGNNAVHPGEIDLKDDLNTVLQLLELVNIIAEVMIGHPKRIEALYEKTLSPGQKAQVQSRDAPASGRPADGSKNV